MLPHYLHWLPAIMEDEFTGDIEINIIGGSRYRWLCVTLPKLRKSVGIDVSEKHLESIGIYFLAHGIRGDSYADIALAYD